MWLSEEIHDASRLQRTRAAERADDRAPEAGAPARNGAEGGAAPRFELRYRSVSRHRCGYVFPCDAEGHVDLDALSERARENYLYARAVVGLDLMAPEVSRVD